MISLNCVIINTMYSPIKKNTTEFDTRGIRKSTQEVSVKEALIIA